MSEHEIYRVSDGVRVREEKFGLLIVSNKTPALALNDDMKAVWYSIDGKNSYGEVVKIIEKLYPGQEIKSKMEQVFATLSKIGLIERV